MWQWLRPATPPGFWQVPCCRDPPSRPADPWCGRCSRDIGFPNDEWVAKYNAQAEEQKEDKRNYMRREAEKGDNGRYVRVEAVDWGQS
jgi:hypothetical protein